MSVAAAGVPLTNPKKGPKSRVAVNPGRYRPDRLVPNDASSTGKPSVTWMRSGRPAGRGPGQVAFVSRGKDHVIASAHCRRTGHLSSLPAGGPGLDHLVPGQRCMAALASLGGEPVLKGEPADPPEPLTMASCSPVGQRSPPPRTGWCPPHRGRGTASSPARTAAPRGGGPGRSARRRARPAAPPTHRRSGGPPRSAPGPPRGPPTGPGRRCGPPGRGGPTPPSPAGW